MDRRAYVPRGAVLAAALLAALPHAVRGQCPDGTPLPCGARPVRPAPPLSVAVLDFENLSRDTGDAYLSGELAEELTARLGEIGRFTIAPRLAVRRLRAVASMSVPEIGRALNVAYLVTGSLRRSGERLRIAVELLRAANASQVWTRQYDRSERDLLALQVALATDVAAGVAGRLLPAERTLLAARPTRDPAAWDSYLRGRALYRASSARGLETLGAFERAIALDSGFAEAWAMASRTHMRFYENGLDRGPQRLALARTAAERAMAIAPRAAESHLAMGTYYYYSSRDYGRALEAFQAALHAQPNNVEIHNQIANVARRQGLWDLSLEMRTRAMAIDPTSWLLVGNRGDTYRLMRRYAEARVDYDRALTLATDSLYPLLGLVALADAAGEPATAAYLTQLAARVGDVAQSTIFGDYLVIWRFHELLQDAVTRVPLPERREARLLHFTILQEAAAARGRSAEARAAADSARALSGALLASNPDDWQLLIQFAQASALLDRCAEAEQAAQRATDRLPVTMDALDGPAVLLVQARVQATCGNADAAIDRLARLLTIPSGVTAALLRSDPAWVSLRDHPRFQRLLAAP